MNCPRCGKDAHGGYAHTCTPTEGWRKMETEIADLKRQLQERTEQLRKEYLSAIDWAGKHQEATEKLAESQAREARIRELIESSLEGWTMSAGLRNHIESTYFALPHDDTALREYRDAVIEECAVIAGNSCLVPPDGGSPTVDEAAVGEEAARRIRKLKSTSVPAGYTEEELERDNPYNQWMHE